MFQVKSLFFLPQVSNKETLKELVKVGANVNAKDNNGTTPLHLAARKTILLAGILVTTFDLILSEVNKYFETHMCPILSSLLLRDSVT